MADYCRENNIAFNKDERLIIDINRSKESHKIFSGTIEKLYKGRVEDEAEHCYTKLKNFSLSSLEKKYPGLSQMNNEREQKHLLDAIKISDIVTPQTEMY